MTIEHIRRKLVDKIIINTNWIDSLNDTNPGHYGIEEWNIQLVKENIWVDIPNKIFTFKKATFDFELMLGSSNDGAQMSFTKEANGEGSFSFSPDGKDIIINSLKVEFDLNLFD